MTRSDVFNRIQKDVMTFSRNTIEMPNYIHYVLYKDFGKEIIPYKNGNFLQYLMHLKILQDED